MTARELILAMSIPSASFAALIGLLVWWFKRQIEKREREVEERENARYEEAKKREESYEKLMLMIMQTGRASFVLAKATATAVQRIPDAQCNGDMHKALEQAEKIQKEEQEFLVKAGVQHIFGNSESR